MTINAEKCEAVLEAERRTGHRVTVTFNLRFTPFATAIKEAIAAGAIGKVLCVHMEDTLSVNMRCSGGALVNYSLVAHSPWAGFRASIKGTEGRLELAEYHAGFPKNEAAYTFDGYNHQGRHVSHTVPQASGGHGGGAPRLRRMIFESGLPDPLFF